MEDIEPDKALLSKHIPESKDLLETLSLFSVNWKSDWEIILLKGILSITDPSPRLRTQFLIKQAGE